METITIIDKAITAIIPKFQLKVTKKNLEAFADCMEHLKTSLQKCPKIGETDGMKEHPAIFHYFYGSSDFYICEYEPDEGLMFGYGIHNGDLPNSEWGYFSVFEFADSKYVNIDYHFKEQSIEAALYNKNPRYFKKPESLM